MRNTLLIATDSFLPRWDGISRFLSEIIPVLAEDYDITVVAPRFKGSFKPIEGVKTILIPTYKFQVGDYPPPKFEKKKISRLVRQSDLVWTNTLGPIGYTTIKAASRHKKRVIAFVHSIEWELVPASLYTRRIIGPFIKWFVKHTVIKLYNRCNLLMVPFDRLAKELREEGIATKKMVVHLGTNVEVFKPPYSKNKAKRELNIPPSATVIGFCGRLGYEKDVLTLKKAFDGISKRRKNVKLLIVGGGRPEIARSLRGKGVILAGSQDQVVPYYQAMDIYVLPSLTETTSLTTLEAMSCGIPAITTPVGLTPEYIQEGKNGFHFKKGDVKELMAKLEVLIDHRDLRDKVGMAARQTVIDRHRWIDTAKRIGDIIKKQMSMD